jgi:hypothetical protein
VIGSRSAPKAEVTMLMINAGRQIPASSRIGITLDRVERPSP